MKLARRILSRLLHQHRLVELAPNRVGGSRHHSQVSEAHLAIDQGIDCLPELGHVIPDGNPVGRSRTGHVTVDADPVDGGGRAVVLVVLGGGKLGRRA